MVRKISTLKLAKGVKRLSSILGAGAKKTRSVGRPKGTYKYGVPLNQYNKQLSQKKMLYDLYSRQQAQRLRSKGFTPQKIQELQQREITEKLVKGKRILENSVPDQEARFDEFVARTQVTPRTQAILDDVRRVQLKGKRDDVNMQRRLRERKMVSNATNIMATPFIFKDNSLDVTNVDDNNILMAENVFKERPDNQRILSQRSVSILQTKEAGNDLHF